MFRLKIFTSVIFREKNLNKSIYLKLQFASNLIQIKVFEINQCRTNIQSNRSLSEILGENVEIIDSF